ncbi:hypothetical protein [Streptomyces sp. NBC_00057]|uniref:hypothetical protein n=1 Tax=Streptomyces sp. NBC_00057 TaxID=2975634 RepID=UPI0032442D69
MTRPRPPELCPTRFAVSVLVSFTAVRQKFFDRLKDAGLLVRTRVLPSGDLRGYTVALPDDRNKDREPVFHSGSILAPDLSLPRIQARFDTTVIASPPDGSGRKNHPPRQSGPAAARRTATHAAWAAVVVLDQGDDGASAGQIAAAGEVLVRLLFGSCQIPVRFPEVDNR